VLAGELPILPQRRPALGCPLDHEAHRPRRDAAGDDGQIVDTNLDLTAGVDRVEVRGVVIVVVDVDLDPVELTDAQNSQTRGTRDPRGD